MRLSQTEKMEIIRMVDGSDVGANKTLKQLGINKSTFYGWYNRYLKKGFDGLAASKRDGNRIWNKIPQAEKNRVVEVALDKPDLSARELAWHITDTEKRFISESSVFRILKERGLITAPAHILLSAADEFEKKSKRVNEMWQTDFTYFRIVGWGYYYLCTILDDHSRFIIAWELKKNMTAEDARSTVDKAILYSGISPNQMPKLLSDNGSCFIANDFRAYLKDQGIKQINGAPMHPQTQGKIERYHRTMKNIVKLDNYYSPEELERALKAFVHNYNYNRYHESLENVTPADVYFGRAEKIKRKREKIKLKTIESRREEYLKQKMNLQNKKTTLTLQN